MKTPTRFACAAALLSLASAWNLAAPAGAAGGDLPDGDSKIMPPYVFRYHGEVPEDWGVSGVVLIAESHISIHTFPDKGYLSLDIFL